MDRKPNIIVLMSDQHRQDIAGCYGHPTVQTPNIDSLAAQGTRFDNAYCTSPLCGPARVSFMTGTYPHTNGAVTHPNDRHRSGKTYRPQIRPGIQSLVSLLRDGGYQTHACGYTGFHHFDGDRDLDSDNEFLGYQTDGARKWHYSERVGKKTARQYHMANTLSEMWEPSYANVEGLAFNGVEEDMWDSMIASDAVQFLQNRTEDRPFFLYCGFRAPHTPWCPPERFLSMYDPQNIGDLPDYKVKHSRVPRRLRERFEYFDIAQYPEEMVRRSIAAYYGFVSYMDHCVGQVLEATRKKEMEENTIIVYLADHGENLYRHGLCEKHCFYEGSVKIPLIISSPDWSREGKRSDALVSIMDVMPTLLTEAGIDIPQFVEGKDLHPVFSGKPVRDFVLSEYCHTLDPCRMLFDGRYKYIHTEEDICELYDLTHDPDELINLAWYPQYADLVRRYDQLVLSDWEVPNLPVYAAWNDLNERKQRQRLAGLDIIDVFPSLPDWALSHGI
jgi:choline-sulfatase